MALNWHTFRTRTLTALVFVAIMLVGLLWNQWSFFILFSVIHFGCWWEYLKLVEKIHHKVIDKVIKYFLCICGYLLLIAIGYNRYSFDFTITHTLSGIPINVKWIGVILSFALLFVFLFQNKQVPHKMKWAIIFGFIYISASWGLMIDLYNGVDIHVHDTMIVLTGGYFPIFIIISIWINDTMAYIVGSLIGKTPLTKISPKKTWEGTVGGIILCVAAMGYLFPLILFGVTNYVMNIFAAAIAGIASISGTFGDLFESKLKRMAGVKDSGHIMPGHGGFLDRFDSLLFAVPAAWLVIKLVLMR